MLFMWSSGTSCARWYNETFRQHSLLPILGNWPCGFELDCDHVWDSFIIPALIEDAESRGLPLELDHSGQQRERMVEAMRQRNNRIIDEGQPELRHACKGCVTTRIKDNGEKEYIDAAVTDGVTIGHPCCQIQDCQNELKSNRDEFCQLHHDLHNVCHVIGCNQPARDGFKTCNDKAHANKETHLRAKGLAMFQLRSRLKQLNATSTEEDEEESDEDEEAVEAEVCDSKSPTGNVKVSARFSRRRTHNEQLIIRPCGVILHRATFFGSEAISGVKHFVLATFRNIGLPSFLFYDNNCSLYKLLKSQGDRSMEEMGMPVDVFHFKSKHSVTDIVCQTHCNPAAFDGLTEGDKWVFNSSIAEQTNVWFGRYHSIVREMRAVKYRFFLDEMIRQRNKWTIAKLEKEGKQPHYRRRDMKT
ncbi:hypothetical protein FRC02_003630 [Tulasnella sp. 418]|nr:hypothetical protein FRC02_003630 [Tulasnella sp. 418]